MEKAKFPVETLAEAYYKARTNQWQPLRWTIPRSVYPDIITAWKRYRPGDPPFGYTDEGAPEIQVLSVKVDLSDADSISLECQECSPKSGEMLRMHDILIDSNSGEIHIITEREAFQDLSDDALTKSLPIGTEISEEDFQRRFGVMPEGTEVLKAPCLTHDADIGASGIWESISLNMGHIELERTPLGTWILARRFTS